MKGARREQRSMSRRSVAAYLFIVLSVAGAGFADDESPSEFFDSQVLPILREKCLGCHSHAARSMEGGLTLDSKSGWSAGGDRGPAIVPGNPDASLVVKAVRFDDPDLQMPPDDKLSEAEIATLVHWIKTGASDPRTVEVTDELDTDWWSLKPLIAPDVPGSGHPIDAFVRHRLKQEEIEPTPSADRVSVARRLYVDLHGMLPTHEEVSEFVDDDAPDAAANLIDRLLASPRYGERWARHWLDVIHFADSHGCEHDVKRPNAWRFRDYVIDRLNSDVPWSRFIREQLATDAFFPDQPQLTPALGFISAGPLELSRAGTAPITFDYLDRDDMVTQTMASFVSTTANCARCHTHKFDPITQEDYYALQAVFAGVGKGDVEYEPTAEVMHRRSELTGLLAAATARDASMLLQPKYAEIVESWIAKRRSQEVRWQQLTPDVFVSSGGASLTLQDDNSVLATGTVPDEERYTVTASVDIPQISAIRLDVLTDPSLPHNGPGRAGNGNLHLAEIDVAWFSKGSNGAAKPKIFRASADFDQVGWTSAHAIDGDNKTGWAIHPRVDEPHFIVFEFDTPIENASTGRLAITLNQLYPSKHIIGRFRVSVTDAERGAALVLPEEATAGLSKPASERTPAEAAALAAVALEEHAKLELTSLPPMQTTYAVSANWSHAKKLPTPQEPKVVHLLQRGAFDKPVREVGPGTLTALKHSPARFELADPKKEPLRRAALADWIAHLDNPLTWRSVVNRVWHYHFGRGLCDTPNDFGRMGSQPSHPELLDWLAIWFRDEANGSLKELHRLILTSATWQQSSLGASNSADIDNRLLWRMNRQRLDADVYRDSVLRITNRLDPTMGGPGIEQFVKTKGPQATPTLDYEAYDWSAAETHRRSIYRVVWRGIPDPFMEAMDFPDLGLLAPKRGFSVSALQSLAIYNNDFVLHASRWFAERLERQHSDVESQVRQAVREAWLRTPTPDEQNAFTHYVKQHGLAAFCRVLLNSNEFLFVD